MPRKKIKKASDANTVDEKLELAKDEISSQQAKMKLAYALAGIFGVIIIAVWLNSVRASLTGQSDALGLSRLADEIQKGLAKYDGANAASATSVMPVINLTAINRSVEKDIGLQAIGIWPEKKLLSGMAKTKYPEKWILRDSSQKAELGPSGENDSAGLTIVPLQNAKKLGWREWEKSEPNELKGLQAYGELAAAASSTKILAYKDAAGTGTTTYFIIASGTTHLLKVTAKTKADDAGLKGIFEKIISNISLSK